MSESYEKWVEKELEKMKIKGMKMVKRCGSQRCGSPTNRGSV